MSFFAELKRRNVLRIAIAYVAVSWLLIQVAETLFPVYGLSDAAIRIVVAVLGVGFIPALIAAWVFEMTPAGLKRDSEVGHTDAAAIAGDKKFDRIIIVVLALSLGYFAFDKFVLDPTRDAERAVQIEEQVRTESLVQSYGDRSIAVLPFVNMSSDPEQAYFSDGISEELLNLLARIPQLRVTSRSSSFQFRGDALDLPEVARKLNVAHILEGSVRKAGKQVRITVQLIEAKSDTHLWSETYDRPLDDIFAIQDEVAEQVVAQLRMTLLGETPKAQPANLDAYALLLEARQIVALQKRDEFSRAEKLLKEALLIDPDYVDALNQLILVYWVQRQAEWPKRWDELTDRIEKLRARVLELDPDNATTKGGIAWDIHHIESDIVRAARLYEEALEHEPSNWYPLRGSGVLAQDIGRSDLSIPIFEYLVERDPMTLWNYGNLGWAYIYAGRYDEAIQQFAMMSTLNDRRRGSIVGTGIARLLAGDPAGAITEFEQIEDDYDRLYLMIYALHELGGEDESAAAIQRLHEMAEELAMAHPDVDVATADFQLSVEFANIYAWTGNADEAFRYLEIAAGETSGIRRNISRDPFFRRLHDDPRWLPFLRSIGQAPEQLAEIEFNPRLPDDLLRNP